MTTTAIKGEGKMNVSKLKTRRVAVGMTQKELADKTKLSMTTISAFESGKAEPTLKHAREIAFVLKCGIEDIF